MLDDKKSKNNLRKIRTERKLTIKELSDKAGIPMRTYQNYEYGEREMTATAIQRLADFYGVSTDYLLGRDTGEPAPIDALAGSFNMSALEQKILEGYLNLPADMRGDLMDFLQSAVREVMRDTQEES